MFKNHNYENRPSLTKLKKSKIQKNNVEKYIAVTF